VSSQDLLAGATTIWAIAMALSPGMQIRTMLQTRSSEDVSLGYFGVLLVGFVLWAAYGVSIDNYVLVVPNSLATLVATATVVVALRLRKDAEAQT